jgi:putative membrane protein
MVGACPTAIARQAQSRFRDSLRQRGAQISAVFAFLHHLAAFTLVAALVVEFVLIRGDLTATTARKIARADMIFGISSGVLVIVGLLRVFYFEKGAAYYFHSGTFLAKLGLFILVGLLSIYPTMKFISWRKALDPSSVPAIRRIIHLELVAVVFILLFAALMADGIGYLGRS